MSLEEPRTSATMNLVGGDLSLDFVNTASGRDGDAPDEKLTSYADLVAWAEHVGLASRERGDRLRREAERRPADARDALEDARALREVIFRVFASDPPAPADLEALGRAAAEASARRRLEPTEEGYALVWPEGDALEQLLWPVALAAAELLTSEDRARVKECASVSCDWLFLDISRNRSRRWCDMRECGNRAKARRYLARQRKRGTKGG